MFNASQGYWSFPEDDYFPIWALPEYHSNKCLIIWFTFNSNTIQVCMHFYVLSNHVACPSASGLRKHLHVSLFLLSWRRKIYEIWVSVERCITIRTENEIKKLSKHWFNMICVSTEKNNRTIRPLPAGQTHRHESWSPGASVASLIWGVYNQTVSCVAWIRRELSTAGLHTLSLSLIHTHS